jgi:hypothetical protein
MNKNFFISPLDSTSKSSNYFDEDALSEYSNKKNNNNYGDDDDDEDNDVDDDNNDDDNNNKKQGGDTDDESDVEFTENKLSNLKKFKNSINNNNMDNEAKENAVRTLVIDFIAENLQKNKRNSKEIRQLIFEVYCDKFDVENLFRKDKNGTNTVLLGDYAAKHKIIVNKFIIMGKTEKKILIKKKIIVKLMLEI